ncbi:hemerythrin [Clostridium beijerinckii]|nr:hemerythrin [Clostridium beijerinckii]
MSSFAASVDVRIYEKGKKKSVIFKAFEELALGETMELINDHDPRPLYQQFMMKFPEQFEWEYLKQGPEIWRIGITKKQKHN